MDTKNTEVVVAIHQHIINKHQGGDTRLFAEGWLNVELLIDDFAKCINEGWAYCAQMSGTRKTQNFLRCNISSVDIDSGMTMEEALSHPFCQSHLSLVYRTFSNTLENPRFRLVFVLPRLIESAVEQVAVNNALNIKFHGDPSTRDAARIFFGNADSEPMVFPRMITEEVLDQLLEIGKPRISDSHNDSGTASRQSAIYLDPDLVIETEKRGKILLKDIKSKLSVKCPFHIDQRASAFVSTTNSGGKFLHCVVCRTTHWMKGSKAPHLPDFVDMLRESNKEIAEGSWNHTFARLEFKPLVAFDSRDRIEFLNKKFFQLDALPSGITLIRSPKGTGKTTTLLQILDPLVRSNYAKITLEQFENQDADEPPRSLETDYKVLLIGHRQALIRDLCKRLNLFCYLDDCDDWSSSDRHRKRRYGVCLDSLKKVAYCQYDLIIIDESEQVFSHFMSKTMRDPEKIFNFLGDIIRTTPAVVALDADLGWTTFLTLGRMKRLESITKSNFSQLHFYINEYKHPARKVEIFDSKAHLIAMMIVDLYLGKKIFVASNSKTLTENLAETIQREFAGQDPKNVIAITSDNSNTKEIQDFILNIKTQAKKFDAILSSPSLNTGLDITFPNNEEHFDTVYGFFEVLINTHTDIDQHLSRVRHPKNVRVWVSSRKFNMSTSVTTIKTDLLLDHIVANTAIGRTPIPAADLSEIGDPFLNMASVVVSQQRHSKNNLRDNFIAYKIQAGFEVIHVKRDDLIADEGKFFYREGKRAARESFALSLIDSRPIGKQRADEIEESISANEEVSLADKRSLSRSRIEAFYRAKITENLIAVDRNGLYRSAVKSFESLFDPENIKLGKDISNYLWKAATEIDQRMSRLSLVMKLELGLNENMKAILIRELLKRTPVFDGKQFLTTVHYTADDLSELARTAKKHKRLIEGQVGITVRGDVMKKPTQFLGDLLGTIGLRHEVVKMSKKDDTKIYVYSLKDESLQQVTEITRRRREIADGWKFVDDLNGISPQDEPYDKGVISHYGIPWDKYFKCVYADMVANEKLRKFKAIPLRINFPFNPA